MEDKKKNDIATKPLNAGQRVAARGVLCGALADGSSVMDWLSGTPNQSLACGDITPLQWWGGLQEMAPAASAGGRPACRSACGRENHIPGRGLTRREGR